MSNLLLELEEELATELTDIEFVDLATEMVKNQKRADHYQQKADDAKLRLQHALGEDGMISFLNEKGLQYTALVNQNFTVTAWQAVAEQRHASGKMSDDEFGDLMVSQSYESTRLIQRKLPMAHLYNHDNPEVHIVGRRARNPKTAPRLTRELALEFVEETMLTATPLRELAEKYGVTVVTINNWRKKLKSGDQVPYLLKD